MALLILFLLIITSCSVTAVSARNLITSHHAILCLSPINLEEANQPQIAASGEKEMGCMSMEAGVRVVMQGDQGITGPLRVRLYPNGVSLGLTVWGFASAFSESDGTILFFPAVRASYGHESSRH